MKANRKTTKKMSVITANAFNYGAVVVMALAVAIIGQLASSRNTQLHATENKKESQLRALENECAREASRWEEMKSPERLESALRRLGMKMAVQRPGQFVKMRSDGTPAPGQIAMKKARQRLTALNENPFPRPNASRRKRQ